MMDVKYNLQFEKLCTKLELGELISEPKALQGGLLHKMYEIQTTGGKYAIKALNPQIMLRATAMKNYINSELIATMVSKTVPVAAAVVFHGKTIQTIEEQCYLIFKWEEGKSLAQSEIKITHCEKIAAILAGIHNTDFSSLKLDKEPLTAEEPVEWKDYLEKGKQRSSVWADMLEDNMSALYIWNHESIAASNLLPIDVISHRDLDSKNVMWKENQPLLIDWEAAGYTNSVQDVLETAIYWSKDEHEIINKRKILTFLQVYKSKCPSFQANWEIALKRGSSGSIGWLEYNMKRSLGIECTGVEEQELGTQQVIKTLHELRQYADTAQQLLEWLN